MSHLYFVLVSSRADAVLNLTERLISDMSGSPRAAHDFFLAVASGTVPLPPLWSNGNASARLSAEGELDFSALALLPVDVAAGERTLLQACTPSERTAQIVRWADMVQASLALIAHIVPRDLAPGFLLQLVAGRFNNVTYA